MNQKRSGIFLEVLASLAKRLAAVGQKATETETLHARIVELVDFCDLKPADVGAWIEYDSPDKGLLLRMHELLGSDVGRPRLVSKSKLCGTLHLKAPPKTHTIARLLSPTGAKTYRLPTMLGHLRYIVIYCADHMCRSVEPEDRNEQLAFIARGMFKNVADSALEHYEALSASDDSDDAIDLNRARSAFGAKSQGGWRNINAELEALAQRIEVRPLEARQLSAAFLLGDEPSLLAVSSASASRAAAEIALFELVRSEGPFGLWLRGAVGSGKSTILYQLSLKATEQGWQTYFLSGLPVARLTTDLLATQIKEHLTERTLIVIDNAEFLSNETLLHISNFFREDGPPDLPAHRALILATQTERLSTTQLALLRKFASAYAYVQPELKRDKALYADRLNYMGYPSDIESLANLIHESGLASRLSISEIRTELAQRFNDRGSALLLSALISVIGGRDIRSRISDSIQGLGTQNIFAIVPGFDVFPGPIPVTLGIIALCRYRYATISRRKFFCDEHLIAASLEEFFSVDTGVALSVAKRIMEILWDELFFDVQYLSVSPTDPWRFERPSAGKRARARDGDTAAVNVGGLVDTRHPEVTETIYKTLFRPSPDGIPARLDEEGISIIIGRAARKCALTGRVRHYEHSRTFLTLGRSFDSRVRDGYYDYFHDWVRDLPAGDRGADLAARFCLEAGKAFIDSLFEAELYRTDEPDREDWLNRQATDLLDSAELHSNSSWRSADLGWLRTDVAVQRIRLLQLRQYDSVVQALVLFFENPGRKMSPGNLAATCSVIRAIGHGKLEASGVLDAFEADCHRASDSPGLEAPFYMELGRYSRDIRPLTTSSALIDAIKLPDQISQVLFFFQEALRGENVADGWYAELYAFSAERSVRPLGEFRGELLDDELDTLRGILRAGLKRFDCSVRLSAQLARLEISEAKRCIAAGDANHAGEIVGAFLDPAVFTVRRLMRTLVQIQAEKLPVSIASDFLPVLREHLDLEFAFGSLEPVIDDNLQRYSIRWWVATYLGGGQEGRVSLSAPNHAKVHDLVPARQLFELANTLWIKGKEGAGISQDCSPLEALGREAAGLLIIAMPAFRRRREWRNELRVLTLALDIASHCKTDWLQTQREWFAEAALRDEVGSRVETLLSKPRKLKDVDRELLLAAATALNDASVSERVRRLVETPSDALELDES